MGQGIVPKHGESHEDFCKRVDFAIECPEQKKKIDEKFGRFNLSAGSLYWFRDQKLNTKQINFFRVPEAQQIYLVLTMGWYEEWYICFMTDIVRKEFLLVDFKARAKMFDELKFNTAVLAEGKISDDKSHFDFQNDLKDYEDKSSRWYVWYNAPVDKERGEFIKRLAQIGFAYLPKDRPLYFAFYCTAAQYEKFLLGSNPRDGLALEDELLGRLLPDVELNFESPEQEYQILRDDFGDH